jgi:hypothetical protein
MPVFQRRDRGGSSVVMVDPAERPAAGDGQGALSEQGAHLVHVPAVQQAVAQGDPLGRGERLLFGRAHGCDMRIGVVPRRLAERLLLGNDAVAVIVIAVSADERLGDKPLRTEHLRRG